MTRLSSSDLEPNSVDERGRDGARQFCWERQEKEIHKVHAASGAKVVRYEDWMGLVDSLSYLSDEFPNCPKVRRGPTDGGRSTNGRHNIDLTSFALRRSSRLRHSSPRRQLLPQPNLSAAAFARPPLLVQAAPAATARPQSGRVPRARTRERRARQRGNANPMIPSILYQQRAQS